jgi:Type II secretory pathway, ATPase PulE/Tfp pilus assembly pathway, ATPase PilB
VTADRSSNAGQRLGTILVEKGYIADSQLRRALSYQMESGARLGDSLIKLGYVTDVQLAEALAAQKRLTVVQLGDVLPDPAAVGLLTERFIRARQVMPIDFDRGALTLAMVNPLDVVTLDDVRVMTGLEVRPVVATASGFAETVEFVFSHKGALAAGTTQGDEPGSAKVAEDRRHAEDTSIVTLVNNILDTALKRRASDIHFEPQLYEMAVRIRVDGVLHPLTDITNDLKGGVLSRIKIIGDMDIAEKRLPQDGRATYRSPDQTVDLRIASLPTAYGENITIRLLDDSMYEISLEELGMGDSELVLFREALSRPHGQILITGPTGSGKSTTLYSALEELNKPSVKIYTVEDPIERKVPGIMQSQVKPTIGLTFASALRSLVRGDPDIIMIGEIRDLDTAMIATEASLTGHLVLSTLHTNDAPSSITRLAEMGIPPYLISSALHCVVAQRLARRMCPHCVGQTTLRPEELTPVERALLGEEELTVPLAVGCRRCYGTGFMGRLGIYEVLPVTRDLNNLIVGGASTGDLRAAARASGMTTLQEDGLRKMMRMQTTLSEIRRVTI